MADYKVHLIRSAVKDLDVIPQKDLQCIIDHIDLLKKDPRPPVYEKLSGQERYRVRQGNYRIVYSIQDEVLIVCVVKIVRRLDAY